MAQPEVQSEQLPLESVGSHLRRTREAAGLSLGDISARTKIAERHLAAIEQNRFSDLASRTYAVGFARAYARAVGLDETQIADAVRRELAAADDSWVSPQPATFEPGDPARVPGSRLAWVAALGGLAVIVLVFVVWRSFLSPAVSLPELTAPQVAETGAAAGPAKPGPTVVPAGAVVFTALQPGIWVKFYDAAGKQLMQKQMAQGEAYTVPADANGVMLRTARPEALQITIGGRNVPPLSDKAIDLRDVPVSAAALLARAPPSPAPVATGGLPAASTPVAASQPAAKPSAAATSRPAARPSAAASPAPAPRPTAAPAPKPGAAAPAAPPSSPAAPPVAPPAPVQTSTVSN